MNRCPYCQGSTRQNRAGTTKAGMQRYRCMHCDRKYTPEPKKQGYPDSVRDQAVEMYGNGKSLRQVARHLNVAPQTVAYWVTKTVQVTPKTRTPQKAKEEMSARKAASIQNKKTRRIGTMKKSFFMRLFTRFLFVNPRNKKKNYPKCFSHLALLISIFRKVKRTGFLKNRWQ